MLSRMYISELAETVGVTPKTIRYYEEIGLLPEPERTESNYRLYTLDDVLKLAFIKKAQTFGMSLDEIKGILTIRENGHLPCEHVRSLLTEKLHEIDQQLAHMRELRRELAAYLDDVEDRAQSGEEEAICPDIEGFQSDIRSTASPRP